MSYIFNFPLTCNKIDEQINICRHRLRTQTVGMVKDINPDIETPELISFVDYWSLTIFEGFKKCFETIRQLNVDMRIEAEIQIKALSDSLSDTENELFEAKQNSANLSNAESEIENLQNKLANAESQIYRLNEQLFELQCQLNESQQQSNYDN